MVGTIGRQEGKQANERQGLDSAAGKLKSPFPASE